MDGDLDQPTGSAADTTGAAAGVDAAVLAAVTRGLDPTGLDARGTVTAAAGCVRAQIIAGCHLLILAAHWADLHPGDGLPLHIKLDRGADERRLVLAGD